MANVTLIIATRRTSGIIMYHGYDQHAAVEVFRRRVRVSYDIGNYPVSTMFSYEQISDGDFHTIQLLIYGKNFTMVIDNGLSQTIINEGEKEYLQVSEPMYLGGVPADIRDNAFKKWHIRHTESFGGE